MAGHPLFIFRGHILYRFGHCQLLALRSVCIYRRGEADGQTGGAVHRFQRGGAGDQSGLHVAVCGKVRSALHAGEDCGYVHRHVLELCDEAESRAGMRKREVALPFFCNIYNILNFLLPLYAVF